MNLSPRFLLLLTALLMVALGLPAPDACSETMLFMRGDSLWASDTQGNSQRFVASFEGLAPSLPALSPDGAMAAIAAGRDEATGLGYLYLVPVAGGAPRRLFPAGVHSADSPAFSPDGEQLAIVAASAPRRETTDGVTYADMSISLLTLADGSATPVARTKNALLDAGYIYDYPSFAPDWRNGKGRIAYQSSGSDVSGGFTILDESGSELFSYPRAPSDHMPYWRPQFLPDGRNVLVWTPSVDQSSQSFISLVDTATGSRRFLAEGSRPTLADRGMAMVFERCAAPWNAERCDLWRLELREGASPTLVVKNADRPAGAPFSLD